MARHHPRRRRGRSSAAAPCDGGGAYLPSQGPVWPDSERRRRVGVHDEDADGSSAGAEAPSRPLTEASDHAGSAAPAVGTQTSPRHQERLAHHVLRGLLANPAYRELPELGAMRSEHPLHPTLPRKHQFCRHAKEVSTPPRSVTAIGGRLVTVMFGALLHMSGSGQEPLQARPRRVRDNRPNAPACSSLRNSIGTAREPTPPITRSPRPSIQRRPPSSAFNPARISTPALACFEPAAGSDRPAAAS